MGSCRFSRPALSLQARAHLAMLGRSATGSRLAQALSRNDPSHSASRRSSMYHRTVDNDLADDLAWRELHTLLKRYRAHAERQQRVYAQVAVARGPVVQAARTLVEHVRRRLGGTRAREILRAEYAREGALHARVHVVGSDYRSVFSPQDFAGAR